MGSRYRRGPPPVRKQQDWPRGGSRPAPGRSCRPEPATREAAPLGLGHGLQTPRLPEPRLIGAAVLASIIGDLKDAAVIVFVVLFNTVLGLLQEHQAERTLAALKVMVALEARVLRGGRAEDMLLGGPLRSLGTLSCSRQAAGFPPTGGCWRNARARGGRVGADRRVRARREAHGNARRR